MATFFARPCRYCGKEFMPNIQDMTQNPERDVCYNCSPAPPLKVRKRTGPMGWIIVAIIVIAVVALIVLT